MCRILTALLLSLALPAGADPLPPTVPEAGTVGYGLTVFEGEEVERFEVEFLGALESWGSVGDVLLARLSGGPLAKTGVIQGMSGSPVYVGDHMVGAVMSAWPFATDAIAGIRPLAEMQELERFLDEGGHPSWRPGQERVPAPQQLGELAPLDPGGSSWAASGFAPHLLPSLRDALGVPVQAAGRGAAASGPVAGTTLAPGDGVAVMLVDGSAKLYSVGTVTARREDSILAFGHPFLGAGPVSLPMHRAQVVTVLPSSQISFKLASPGPEVGAVLLDRRAGIAGRLGVTADTLPLSLALHSGGATVDYGFRIGRIAPLVPQLAGWCVQSALEDQHDLGADSTVRLQLVARARDGRELRSAADLAGPGAGEALAGEVGLPLALMLNNPEAAMQLATVELDIDVVQDRRSARLGRARAGGNVEAGQTLRARVELVPWRAAAEWVDLELELPASLPEGRYMLSISDGATAFRSELARASARWSHPSWRTITDAFELREPAGHLVAVLYGPSRNAVVHGRELRRWPASHRALLGMSGAAGADVAATAWARTVVPTSWVLSGQAAIPVEIGQPEEREAPRGSQNGGPR